MTVDYYEFLGLTREDLPRPDSKENRILLKEILDAKFRMLAPLVHPDRGGDSEQYKILLRAVTILGDDNLRKQYDGDSESELFVNAFNIDWEKYFCYNPDSSAAIKGHEIAENIKTITSANILFEPTKQEHGYNWIFDLKYDNEYLTLSLVFNEKDILALTDGNDIDNSLPFKIYLYFPSSKLKMQLDYTSSVKIPNSEKYLINPKMKYVTFEDIALLQTTNYIKAIQYLQNQLLIDLEKIAKNEFIGEILPETVEKRTATAEVMRAHDRQQLEEIFAIKTPKFVENNSADAFLQNIPIKPIKRISEQVIKVKSNK